MSAIRNMKAIPRYENRTIYGDLEKKVAATRVLLYSRPPGKFLSYPLSSAFTRWKSQDPKKDP
jgi:hypothetical protein